MNTQEAKFEILSYDRLDAVVGGMMNDGKQQLINKDQQGVPGSNGVKDSIWKNSIGTAIVVGVFLGFVA